MKTFLTLGLLASVVLASPQRDIKTGPNGLAKDAMEEAVEESIKTEKEPSESRSCFDVMGNNGLNFSSFWHGAAHGLHSIHLEEIREWFEPEATADNKIPRVNTNMSAQQPILFSAPLAGYDTDFKTMALKVMAFFMLNDRPDFYQQGVNTLEKLTHQYHMHEIYAAAAPIYQRMKENPPTDAELCPCVNDITGNGILTELVNIARLLKYFGSKRGGRACGASAIVSNSYSSDSYGDDCYQHDDSYDKRRRSGRKVTHEEVSRYEQEYLANSSHQNANLLLKVAPWKPNSLVGPEQWITYEAMLTKSMLEEEELNDFAIFMYCKLNQPELDHPKDLFD